MTPAERLQIIVRIVPPLRVHISHSNSSFGLLDSGRNLLLPVVAEIVRGGVVTIIIVIIVIIVAITIAVVAVAIVDVKA